MTAEEHSERRGTVQRFATPLPVQAAAYLLLAVVFAALGLSGMWDAFSLLPDRVSPWWTLVAATPAAALVLLKRRASGIGLIAATAIFAADLLTVGGIVPLLAMLELFHAYVVSLPAVRRGRLLPSVVVVTLFMACAALLLSGDLRVAVMIGIQFGALLGLSYWYANSTAQSRELVELYRQRAEDASRLAELDREAAVRGERERMARELHDVVAGHVSAVAIRSEAALSARGGVPRTDRDEAAEEAEDRPERRALRAVRDSSLEAHGALRSMIAVLRDGAEGFAVPPERERIPVLIEEAERSGVRAVLRDEISMPFSVSVEQAIGRVVQESLANAVRHASGSDVEVRLGDDVENGDAVLVEVVSRGGEPLASPGLRGSGLGLRMLEERVRMLGGEFAAGPDGDGWAVRARLPRGAEG